MQPYQTPSTTRTVDRAVIDQGLRKHMLRVYDFMSLGLGLTGLVAYLTSQSPALMSFVAQSYWLLVIATLGLVFFFSLRIEKLQYSTAHMVFWAYAALNGLTLSGIFLVYTSTSITQVFLITASVFAGLSLYGYTTKRDVSGWGPILFAGLIGIIVAAVVNIFLKSTMMGFILSAVSVVVFMGLTIYDTQAIKEMYAESDHNEVAGKKALMGALRLYLDFINIFLALLRLFGNRE